jgi:riboflavin biosynthesis pyrimidine reductase
VLSADRLSHDRVFDLTPLDRLYTAPEFRTNDLPAELERLYDGGLGLSGPRLYANFVSSLDGIVALPSVDASPSVISGKSAADRFVMGLLRACADIVLIGSGTLRAEPDHRWTPQFVYPQLAEEYVNLRKSLGIRSEPKLAVLTSSGDLDPTIPALEGALVFTTRTGARRLNDAPLRATVVEMGTGKQLHPGEVIHTLRSQGFGMILSEGGPTVIGQLIRLRLLDELFLTISPIVFGRTRLESRPGLAEGEDLLTRGGAHGELLSAHRHASHLFLRYSLANVHPKR